MTRAISKLPGLYAWQQRRPMSPFSERTERLAFGLPVRRPVFTGSGSLRVVLAAGEPLDHGTDVYGTKVGAASVNPDRSFGR